MELTKNRVYGGNLMYSWQQPKWPNFVWEKTEFEKLVIKANKERRKLARVAAIVAPDKLLEIYGDNVAKEITESFAIEGIRLNRESVWSSVSKMLNIPGKKKTINHYTDGIASLYSGVIKNPWEITEKAIFSWNKKMFPLGLNEYGEAIEVGKWRTTPIKIVSNKYGNDYHKNFVKYEGPPARQVPQDTKLFFETMKGLRGVTGAAVAHFYFVSIHPLSDGNGRISRALADAMLARNEPFPMRLYSISAEFINKPQAYYDALELSQKKEFNGHPDISAWMNFFAENVYRCAKKSAQTIKNILLKTKIWDIFRGVNFTKTELKVINKLLNPQKPFAGKLNIGKYKSLANTDLDTAEEEVNHLKSIGLLKEIDDTLIIPDKLIFENDSNNGIEFASENEDKAWEEFDVNEIGGHSDTVYEQAYSFLNVQKL